MKSRIIWGTSHCIFPRKQNLRRFIFVAVLIAVCLALVVPAASAGTTTTVTNEAGLIKALRDSGVSTIVIEKNISITSDLPKVTRKVTITTDGQPRTLSIGTSYASHVFNVGKGGNLTLTGSGTGTLTLDGSATASSYWFETALTVNKGTLIINDGVNITRMSSSTYPAILVYGGGSVIMNGGNITNNKATNGYSAVRIGDTSYGSGTFTMNGGEISGTQGGPGISIAHSSSQATINGGTISGNTGAMYGGGIHVSSGTLTIIDGTISHNSASRTGGGIYVTSMASVTMEGGTISGNSASRIESDNAIQVSRDGGGIYLASGTLTMTGGTIAGNTATNNGSGIYVDTLGTLTISGTATVDANNDVYLGRGRHITVPATFTGSVSSITGHQDVIKVNYDLVKTEMGVSPSGILNNFHLSDPTFCLTVRGGDTLVVSIKPKPMPEVGSASIAFYNSTAANISFTLNNTVGATGAHVNLTYDGHVITKELIEKIKAGGTVSDVQLTDLTPGTSYQLNITPLNTTAGGTPHVYTHATLFTPPVIDRIDIHDINETNVSATTVFMVKGDLQTYTAKAWNDSTQIVNESVEFTAAEENNVTLESSGNATTVTATNDGTATITASSGSSSSFSIRIFANIPDTLTLTASRISVEVGSPVTLTAVLTNATQSTRYDGIPVNITLDSAVLFSNFTGNPVIWTPAAPGTFYLGAVITQMGSARSGSVPVTVTGSPQPGPTPGGDGSGDGNSSSITVFIDPAGRGSFGTGTGVTAVSFAKDTSGIVTLETRPDGITAPENTNALVEITPPSFNGSAEIAFSVPLAILHDLGLGVNDVVMQHYVNDKWVKLPTFYVGEERGAAHYVALTTGFSPFAIVYEKDGAQTVERSTPQPTKDTGTAVTAAAEPAAAKMSGTTSATAAPTTSAATGGTTAAPTLTQAPAPLAGILLGLLAVGILLRRRE